MKWTDEDFAAATDGQLPLGKPTDEWTSAISTPDSSRPTSCSTRPSSARTPATCRSRRAARWPTGRTASSTCTARRRARCGRCAPWRDGSASNPKRRHHQRIHRRRLRQQGIVARCYGVVPALLSKKANAPVMMRITPRRGALHRARAAGAALAREDRVPQGRPDHRARRLRRRRQRPVRPGVSDSRSAGDHISLSYQPLAMRWRTLTVLTNTPPRGAQRAPAGMQGNALMEPILAKAARKARHRPGRDAPDQRA